MEKENSKTNKVNLMILGFQKSGTTSLSNILAKHPEINFCSQKEPNYFSNNKNWKKKIDDYHNLFKSKPKSKIWAEGSTNYSWLLDYPYVAKSLKDYNENLKFIFIMRDPVYRLKSHYIYYRKKGYTNRNFFDEIKSNPSYILNGLYSVQCTPFLDLFPINNFLFLTLEDFKKNPIKELKKISEFLSINFEELSQIDFENKNKSSEIKNIRPIKIYLAPYLRFIPQKIRKFFYPIFQYQKTIDFNINQKTYEYLKLFYQTDIEKMEKITNMRLKNIWKYKKT